MDKGGCGKTSPGIGDVQFVKDLMTGDIVTTNFRCSKFGVAHNQKTNFGWVCIKMQADNQNQQIQRANKTILR